MMGRGRRAFTLIELLAVVAIVGILAAITLSISSGASEGAKRDRAEAEIALLKAAVESYRAAYGAYPQMNNDPAAFWQALSGQLRPDGNADNRAPFVTLEGLTLDDTESHLVDPWGWPYYYRPQVMGARRSYMLTRDPQALREELRSRRQ